MADKTIKVKVDVETDVEPSIAALKALKKQLKETAAGSEDFQRLQQQINDTEDAIKSARTGASNFTEVLGEIPGPIGDIGNKVSGTVNVLKQFSGLKITDLQSSFVELGKDVDDIFKGFGKLTGITKVYTVLNGALSKSFQAVGASEAAAAAGAQALSAALIATGIGALIVLLGTAASALYELATGEKAAAEAAEQLNSELESQNLLLELNANDTRRRNKVAIAQMKAQGKSEAEIRKATIDNSYKDYQAAFQAQSEATDLYNKSLGKADAETLKKLEDNLTKRQQASKDAYSTYLETGYNAKAEEVKAEEAKNKELAGKAKAASDARLAERKRELEELKKGLDEARLETLSARDKEETVVNEKYDKLKALAIKYGQDTKVVEQARQADLAEIATKYAKEETDKKQKELEDALALQEQGLNLRVAKGELTEKEYQQQLFDIRKNAAIQSELLTNDTLKKQQDTLNNQRLADLSNLQIALQNETITQEQFDAKKLEIQSTYQTNLDTLNTAALEKNKEYIAAQIDLEKYRTEQKKLTAEEERGIIALRLQSQIEALDAENQKVEGDYQQDLERLSEKRALLAEAEANDLANTELTEFQKTEIRQKYADARKNITDQEIATEKAAQQAKVELQLAYLDLFAQFGSTLKALAGENKSLQIAGIVIEQAAAIGKIVVNTGIANAKALAASPLTFGQPWVAINTISAGLSIATSIAGAVKAIQQINAVNTNNPSPNGTGAGGSVSGPTAPAPAYAGAPAAIAAPQIQTGEGVNPSSQIAQTLGAQKDVVKAYVVSGDVTSQQALDRRTNRAATFSGG